MSHISCCIGGLCRYLASGGGDALVSLWDLEHCVCVHTTIGVDMPIRSLSFNNDSSYLAFAVERSNIEIVEVPTGKCCQQWFAMSNDVICHLSDTREIVVSNGLLTNA